MRKIIYLIVVALIFFFLRPSQASASIISIQNDGGIVFNVLSDEDAISLSESQKSFVEVSKITDENTSNDSSVSLSKEDGDVNLVVTQGDEVKKMNVGGFKDVIVEVEERPEIQKIAIKVKDDKFALVQNGVIALTSFPIKVDAKRAVLSVGTSKGDEFLSIMPYEAVEAALRTGLISEAYRSKVLISEGDNQLEYQVSGNKVVDIFGIYKYLIPVTTIISASTGEMIDLDSSTWYKYLKFIYI